MKKRRVKLLSMMLVATMAVSGWDGSSIAKVYAEENSSQQETITEAYNVSSIANIDGKIQFSDTS